MEKNAILDYTMVPSGLLTMVVYHVWLLHRVTKHPGTTVMGLNAVNRKIWVKAMMDDVPKNGILAVQTLRNNIMASTLLASTAIMLCSLIGIMMTNGSQNHSLFLVYGDKSSLGFSIKFFSILVCFLISFLSNVQSIRYFSHASVLINVPYRKVFRPTEDLERVTSEYVSRTVNKGSYFWSLGLRAIYFSFPLFLWIFGPIPMIFSCFAMVILLYFLDVNFECGSVRVRVPGDGDEELAREETERSMHHPQLELPT